MPPAKNEKVSKMTLITSMPVFLLQFDVADFEMADKKICLKNFHRTKKIQGFKGKIYARIAELKLKYIVRNAYVI